MKKTALFLLIATLLTSGLFAGCGETEDNPNVSWDTPSNETMENNVSIDFDTEEIIDVESKETTGEVTEPSDTTAEEDTSKQEDTTTPDTVTTPPETSAPETNPPVTTTPVTTAPQPTKPPVSSTPNGFAVKAKKYTFEGNNLLLLDTENKTDTNYTVSVMVTYYDENGKSLKKETETFEGYAAGYQKYFLFNPGITFDSYTYKVLVEEYNGECLASYIDIKFINFFTTAEPIGGYSANANTGIGNAFSEALMLNITHVTFDSTGEIKMLYDNPSKTIKIDAGETVDSCFKICQLAPFSPSEYPENFFEGCSTIYILNRVEKH